MQEEEDEESDPSDTQPEDQEDVIEGGNVFIDNTDESDVIEETIEEEVIE